MGDLPDWTQAFANAGTLLNFSVQPNNSSVFLDVSNNQSLVIRGDGSVINTKIHLQIDFYTDNTLAINVETLFLTCAPNSFGGNFIVAEVPVYSGTIHITNRSLQDVTVTVIGSSRTVPFMRLLETNNPSREFSVAQAFTAGFGFFLGGTDAQQSLFASQGSTFVTMTSNTAGIWQIQWTDANAAVQQRVIAVTTAGQEVQSIFAFPQGCIALAYTPSANNAAGTANIYCDPAQL